MLRYMISIMLTCVMCHGMKCVNFYGLETESRALVCSWVKPPLYYLDILKQQVGVDTVRLPFSYQLVSCDQDIQALDKAVQDITSANYSIILDFHRVYNTHQSPSPSAEITLTQFIDAWRFVLARYTGNSKVVGVSLFNEYQGNDAITLSQLQTTAVNQLETEFPNRFHYYLGGTSWGGSINGMVYPDLITPRWSHEIHTYGFSNLSEADWLVKSGAVSNHSVFVGEWGFTIGQMDYGKRMATLFRQKQIDDICFWTIAHSWDTGGLWKDDCLTLEQDKINIFKSAFTASAPQLQCLRGKRP